MIKGADKQKHARLKSHISGVLFYGFLIALVVGVFFLSGNQEAGVPRHMAGFSAMRVLTGSMQSEIPQNSLIITRRVDPREIRVGDDITFLVSETITVTHRVIAIHEDMDETGGRGFQTQGVENPQPDREIVLPENIIGRVIWHNLLLGQALLFVRENIIFVGIFAVLLLVFIVAIKALRKPKEEIQEEPEDELSKEKKAQMTELVKKDEEQITRIMQEIKESFR